MHTLFSVTDNFHGTSLQVGFVNLIKRAKDQMNHLWVAEATENSDYFFSFDLPHCLHLKNAAASSESWTKTSNMVCTANLMVFWTVYRLVMLVIL